jgi:hypothetical protein
MQAGPSPQSPWRRRFAAIFAVGTAVIWLHWYGGAPRESTLTVSLNEWRTGVRRAQVLSVAIEQNGERLQRFEQRFVGQSADNSAAAALPSTWTTPIKLVQGHYRVRVEIVSPSGIHERVSELDYTGQQVLAPVPHE